MHDGIIKKIRFFDDKDNAFVGSVAPMLQPRCAKKNEIVFRKGMHPNAIYFVTSGRVSFYHERKKLAFKDMGEGGYVGDIDIIFRRVRSFTVYSL